MKDQLSIALIRLGPRERGGLIAGAAGLGAAVGATSHALGGSQDVSTGMGSLMFVVLIGAALWWHRRLTERELGPQFVSPSATGAWLPSAPSARVGLWGTAILSVLWVVAYLKWGGAGLVAASATTVVMVLALIRRVELRVGVQAAVRVHDTDRRRGDAAADGPRRG